MALLEVTGLVGGYRPDLDILHGVTLSVREGQMVSIIGPNGAGKSTVLKSIFGLVRVKRGHVTFAGEEITRLSPGERLRRGLSIVPQGHNLFPEMTVHENLELGAYIRKDRDVAKDLARSYEIFPELAGLRHRTAGYLSGGQMQMLEMARALLLQPRLILIDEPSLGLSPKMSRAVFAKIGELRASGVAVLIVEQNAEASLRMSDHAYVVAMGATTVHGPAEEIRTNADVRRSYLGASI
jgi:branched-chain amino acid transport system ATP-binding protein